MAKHLPILVADTEITDYKAILEDAKKENIDIKIVDKGGDAQGLIKDNRGQFSGVIINPEVIRPSGLDVVKFSLLYQPTIPIILLTSFKHQIDENIDPARLGVNAIMAKPFNLEMIMDTLCLEKKFDLAKVLELSKNFGDTLDIELEVEEQSFSPIRATQFMSGKKCFFDVYVRLRKGKFVKILQAGDNFEPSKIIEYLDKGVGFFFIRKEVQESYIQYCDSLTKSLTTNKNVGIEKKFGLLFNQAEQTLNQVLQLGVDNSNIVHAQKYTKNVFQFIDNLAAEDDYLKNLLKEMTRFEHAASVVLISGMVAKAAGIESEKSIEMLGTAAFFHDIGLVKEQNKDDLYAKEESRVYNEDEIEERLASGMAFGDEKKQLEKMMKQHPIKGAEMVENIRGINPTVIQIIRQHHAVSERVENQGTQKSQQIHPMAEIVEISDTFVKIMSRFQNDHPDRGYLVQSLLTAVNMFPRRTRDPFCEAMGLFKKTDKAVV